MASRRYRIGKHPKYDKMFDLLKGDSPILNPHGGPPTAHSIHFGDADVLKSHLLERQGFQDNPEIENGYFWRGERGEKAISHLLAAEQQIEAVKLDFERLKQSAANSGKSPPKTMPDELKNKLLKAEARYDIVVSEIAALERLLKVFTDKEGATSEGNILQRGPQGSGKLSGGVLVLVDGQKVELDKDGLRIADSRSPYDGMKTADYFEKICKPWKRENSRLQNGWREKIQAGEIDGTHSPKPKAPWPEKPKKEATA